MPLDWENNVITKPPNTKTRFCSVTIDDPSSCHKVSPFKVSNYSVLRKIQRRWWNYSGLRTTKVILRPIYYNVSFKNIFLSYNYFSPDGTIAVIMYSGAFVEYGQPGLLACTPFTEAKYLVSKQDFVYESPGNRVITRDNVNVSISISILLKINPDSDYVQQLVTNVSQINETIDANIMERVRTMARSIKAREAYSLRGEQHA